MWELLGLFSSGIVVNSQDANHTTSFHLASSPLFRQRVHLTDNSSSTFRHDCKASSMYRYLISMRVGRKYIMSPRMFSLTSPPAPHYQLPYLSRSLCKPNPLSSTFTQSTHIAQRVWRTCDLLDRAGDSRAGAKGSESQA